MSEVSGLRRPWADDEAYAAALDVLAGVAVEESPFAYAALVKHWGAHSLDSLPANDGGKALLAAMMEDVTITYEGAGVGHRWRVNGEQGNRGKVYGLELAENVAAEALPSPGQDYLQRYTRVETPPVPRLAPSAIPPATRVPSPVPRSVVSESERTDAAYGPLPAKVESAPDGTPEHGVTGVGLVLLLFESNPEGLLRRSEIMAALTRVLGSGPKAEAVFSQAREVGILHRHTANGNTYWASTPAEATNARRSAEKRPNVERQVNKGEVAAMESVMTIVCAQRGRGKSVDVRRSTVTEQLTESGVDEATSRRAIQILVKYGFVLQSASGRQKGAQAVLTAKDRELRDRWHDERNAIMAQLKQMTVKDRSDNQRQ